MEACLYRAPKSYLHRVHTLYNTMDSFSSGGRLSTDRVAGADEAIALGGGRLYVRRALY